MTSELPSGTVTFLFTDIEGSTRLLAERGDAYPGLLRDHRGALRRVFTERGGVEVDTQGDAVFFAFAKASDALVAAQGVGRPPTRPLRVRMGLHTGEPELTDEGYVGLAVHKGARIAAAGHGGQILVSGRTKDLAGGDTVLIDLAEHRLKDLDHPVHLFQIGTESFPPLRTVNATNLPRPTTSFVGRVPELAEEAETARNPLTAWSMTALPPGASRDPGFVRRREEGLLLSLDDAVSFALAPD